MQNATGEISPETNVPINKVTPGNEIRNLKKIEPIKFKLDESETYIRLNLVNINEIKKSRRRPMDA